MRTNAYLKGLNPQQRKAVLTVDGPLLLLAGAGTGKTRVIVHRIAHLVKQEIPPENILAVTFTNKAAREMKERTLKLLSEKVGDRLTVCTFHSFCARLLRQHIHHLGYRNAFTIASQNYQTGLVRSIMSELGYIGEGRNPGIWLAHISRAKCSLRPPGDIRQDQSIPHAPSVAEVYELYQRRLKQMDLVDFDDLLSLVLQLWKKRRSLLEKHRELYQYLLIDEYQDTNSLQFQLMYTLAQPRNNICAVGDDDQSIYGWRGANVENILQFNSRFQNATVIPLEQNYRSTPTILQAANQVIANNPDRHPKQLWSHLEDGKNVLIVRAEDENEEARFITDLITDRSVEYGTAYSGFAILYRSNHQSRVLEEELRRKNFPYSIVGGQSFFQRREVLDAISFLETVHNPADDLSLLRILNVPPRGIGDKSIENLKRMHRITTLPLRRLIKENEHLAELSGSAVDGLRRLDNCLTQSEAEFSEPGRLAGKIKNLFEHVGYLTGMARLYKPRSNAIARLENVHEFINSAAEFEQRNSAEATLGGFLESFALLDLNDREESHGSDDENRITLMTVHAAKGLEFPVVIVAGMEQGSFPHHRSMEEHAEPEERRLFYVALTRAQKEVVLTHAERRRYRGKIRRRRPSRFLEEIPDELSLAKSAAEAIDPASEEIADEYVDKLKNLFAPLE